MRIQPSVRVAFGLAVGLVSEGVMLDAADDHHCVSVAEALIPVCVADGIIVAEAVAFGYSLCIEETEVAFIVGSPVGIAEFGYEVAVTQITCVLVASTVMVVVVVMGSRLAQRSAKNPDGDRRSARR